MRALRLGGFLLLVLFPGSAVPVLSQASCPMPLSEAVERALAGKSILEDNAALPLEVATAQQVEAPALAGGGTLVNLPGFASLLGLAQEQGLINRKDGVTTISLTPFSFLAVVQPEYTWNQQLYQKVGVLRHWGGQVAFGGKGDSFDRDGDGMADDPLAAEEPNDIITWEIKYQIGSRDRRDRVNYERYFAAVQGAFADDFDNFTAVSEALLMELDGKNTDDNGCYSLPDLQAALQSPKVAATLANLKTSDEEVREKGKPVLQKIDQRPILTIVYGGTERKDQFGADKRSAAVRGAFTWLGGTNSAELSWSEVESLLEAEDAVTWKLGYNYSRSFLKGSDLAKDGVTLAVAGSYERLQDVPMSAHDKIGKLNVKLSVPLTEGIEIPISVTWANHKDLLTEEDEVRGHIGFTLNLSKLQEQLLGKQ